MSSALFTPTRLALRTCLAPLRETMGTAAGPARRALPGCHRLASSSSDRPMTPLQRAALDAREDLAARLEASEHNEHATSPGTSLETVIDVLSDRRIRAAMRDGVFDGLAGAGKPLDPRRAVGDVVATAGPDAVPRWVDLARKVDAAVMKARSARGSQEGGGNLAQPPLHWKEEAALVASVNALVAEHNRACPPPLQRPRVTAASLFGPRAAPSG